MFAVIVKIQIKPQHREEFIAAMLDDARGSVENEDTCLQFNVVQDAEDENVLRLYEVYADEEAFERHRQMPHYITWRDAVQDWMAAPPEIATGTHIFPADTAWSKQGM